MMRASTLSHGPRIKELHAQGYDYKQIKEIMGFTHLDYIRYHLEPGVGDRRKAYLKNRKITTIKSLLKPKIATFNFVSKKEKGGRFNGSVGNREAFTAKVFKFNKGYPMKSLTSDEVLEKFGEETICYLTGEKIDLRRPRTYEFDHKHPKSRGGDNTINNLGICTKRANRAKFDATEQEFVALCQKVLLHHGYQITPPVILPSADPEVKTTSQDNSVFTPAKAA